MQPYRQSGKDVLRNVFLVFSFKYCRENVKRSSLVCRCIWKADKLLWKIEGASFFPTLKCLLETWINRYLGFLLAEHNFIRSYFSVSSSAVALQTVHTNNPCASIYKILRWLTWQPFLISLWSPPLEYFGNHLPSYTLRTADWTLLVLELSIVIIPALPVNVVPLYSSFIFYIILVSTAKRNAALPLKNNLIFMVI